MNVIMVWAWMLWSSDAVEHERYYGLGMEFWSSDAVENECYYGLGMDARYYVGMDALVIGRRRT